MSRRPPNILYLHSHDTGRHVQPYRRRRADAADPGSSPRRASLFRKAFCAAPTCSASRACLLTGRYAHSQRDARPRPPRLVAASTTSWHIVHTLRDAGYHSVLIGEQHISKEPDVIGYDEVVKIATTRATDVAPVTIDMLRGLPDRPFFLSVGFFETHREFFRPEEGEERYVAPPPNLPDTPETRRDMAAFNASARSLDAGVGAVLDEIDALGPARRHARHLHHRPRAGVPRARRPRSPTAASASS